MVRNWYSNLATVKKDISEERIGKTMSIRDVLEQLRKGEISEDRAEQLLKLDFLERIGEHTCFDHAREARRGIPEIVFGETKTPPMVAEIVKRVIEDREVILVSRASMAHVEAVEKVIDPRLVQYNESSRMIVVDKRKDRELTGRVGIMTAGSSDIAVAEEAKAVAEAMGCKVFTEYDVGVAALHRMLDPLSRMLEQGVDVLVVCAGMEGALPTVICGLTDVPVIGVPTSVGYGFGGKGEAALMGMLQTCSPGLVVVNIDNGIAAGATAALISMRARRGKN
jgi:pyridinium-3,5-biscarboxylic acid mononucleotide synthase